MKCPVCGLTTFNAQNYFSICKSCGWKNDLLVKRILSVVEAT